MCALRETGNAVFTYGRKASSMHLHVRVGVVSPYRTYQTCCLLPLRQNLASLSRNFLPSLVTTAHHDKHIMAPSKPPNAALRDSEIALLRSEYTVLNRLYVRNKNQHRVAVWWKSLSIFRRRLRRIVAPETGKEERARDVEYIRERIASWFV